MVSADVPPTRGLCVAGLLLTLLLISFGHCASIALSGKGLSKDPVPTPRCWLPGVSLSTALPQDRPQEPPSSTVVLVLTAQPCPACLAWLCPHCIGAGLVEASGSTGHQRCTGARPGECCPVGALPPGLLLPWPALPSSLLPCWPSSRASSQPRVAGMEVEALLQLEASRWPFRGSARSPGSLDPFVGCFRRGAPR